MDTKVNVILKIIDKYIYYLLIDIYDDITFLSKYYVDPFYTKEMMLDKLVLDIRNERPKFDKVRKNLVEDCISCLENKDIASIKDNFLENINKKGISPISAYVYAYLKDFNVNFYYNIYLDFIKKIDKNDASIKRYHGDTLDKFSNSVTMYLENIAYYKALEKENEELKNEILELEKIIVKFEEKIVLDTDEILDIKEPKQKSKKVLIVGGYRIKNSEIEQILVEDIFKNKDKIKNADYIIFDTKRNSHSAFNFVKKLNKNISLR